MNIDYPFHFDSRGRSATTGDDDHIRDMIEQFLFTNAGERVNRPDFGSGLLQMIFAPNSQELAAAVQKYSQALGYDAAQACAAHFGETPIEVLGSTETGGIAWRRQDTVDAPWTPLPDVRVTQGADGALEVRSPYLMRDEPERTGDGVKILPDGGFHLRPRGDRVEKVEGKRVSLTRIERALETLPEIAAATALTLLNRKQALGAVVTLTPAGEEARIALGPFRLARMLRQACAHTLEPAERPKHWRFVKAIPVDAQGKRVLSVLRAMFDEINPLGVLDLSIRDRSDTRAVVAFSLAPTLIFFDGHFPERAILPGIAQVHLAVLIAERIWRIELHAGNLTRVKFRRVLQPNEAVVLTMTRDLVKKKLTFSYQLGEIEASRGELEESRP